jgi:hypothetical protein
LYFKGHYYKTGFLEGVNIRNRRNSTGTNSPQFPKEIFLLLQLSSFIYVEIH